MSVTDCIAANRGSLIKARRTYMRARLWTDRDWYAAWPTIAREWNSAAAQRATGGV